MSGKPVRTVVLSELPKQEKLKYFQFLLENDINFSKDERGNYVALIKVLNPNFNYDVDLQKESLINESLNMKKIESNKENIVNSNVIKKNNYQGNNSINKNKNISDSNNKDNVKTNVKNVNYSNYNNINSNLKNVSINKNNSVLNNTNSNLNQSLLKKEVSFDF